MARRKYGFWFRLAAVLLKPPLNVITKRTWRGTEHMPPTGGAILVANHNSQADPLLLLAHFNFDHGGPPRFLAKASLFDKPVLGYLLRSLQQIPVQRGTTDASKALGAAAAAVNAGGAVIIYPEGTTTKDPDGWPARGKTGVARLAMMTGAPVIPIAHWGAKQFHDPITGKIRFRPRTPVTVVAGPPIDLSRWRNGRNNSADLQEMTDHIMSVIEKMLVEIRGAEPPS